MNKTFSKQAETASRKHEKKGEGKSRHCFMEGVVFCNKNSPKQFTEDDMFQILYDGVGNFALQHKLEIKSSDLKQWFKKYIK